MDLFDTYGEDELLILDIQHLGLTQNPWDYRRGAKTERIYNCVTDGNICVKHLFTYTFSNGERDIQDIHVKIEWYDASEQVKLTKEYDKLMSAKQRKQINREIRQGRLDHLEGEAENLRTLALGVPEPFKTQYNTVADNLDFLFSHYQTEVNSYIQRGTMDFENAVNNETDPTILAILAIPALPPQPEFPNGMTVKESIIYQLTGVIP